MREQFYLAGKTTDKNGICWKRSLVKPFEALCDFVSSDGNHDSCCDHGWKSIPANGWDLCNDSYKTFVKTMALDPIRQSRALIACLKSNDSFGCIAEVAFGSAIGKDSHLLICEERTEKEKVWDYHPLYDSYWFVASFPGVTVHCVENDDDAIECLRGILDGYGIACEKRIDFSNFSLAECGRNHGPTRFESVHPEDFEEIVLRMFQSRMNSGERTAYIGDFGADLIVNYQGRRCAVQVKRYGRESKVGVGDVNQVLGAMKYYSCQNAIVITTSGFTQPAVHLAERTQVELWGWPRLAQFFEAASGVTLNAD